MPTKPYMSIRNRSIPVTDKALKSNLGRGWFQCGAATYWVLSGQTALESFLKCKRFMNR